MNKKYFILTIFSILAIYGVFSSGIPYGNAASSQAIIVDHTIVNMVRLDQIPESAINASKSALHIAYGHTSHGSQIISGMTGLITFKNNSLYEFNNGGTGGALDLHDYAMSGDLGNPDRITWVTETRNYLDSNLDCNVIMWSWCGQVSSATAWEIANYYLANMNTLESEYPNVIFVYMTGHLDGTGLYGNLHLRNEQIRAYCIANEKILYDFADIESFNPDNTDFRSLNVSDGCDYIGGNWANEWQAAHPGEWYACSPAHTVDLNGNLKAYAAWWLFARLAGWSGNIQTDGIPNYGLITSIISIALIGVIYIFKRKSIITKIEI